jgi:dihydroflavonol-4-reductase
MKAVVTGGSGFIGTHLIRLLLDRQTQVRVVDIREPSDDVKDRVEYVPTDLSRPQSLRELFEDVQVVFHLAANPQLWVRRRGGFGRVNYWGTVQVIDAAAAAGASRIIHVSTESILARCNQNELISEKQQEVPYGEVLGPYCLSKWRAERYAWLSARNGAPVVIVNPTLPLGPGDWRRTPPTQMILDICRGKRPAYVDGYLNLIDVRDVAIGLLAAAEYGVPGQRYLLGAENWSIQQLFVTVARLAHVPLPRWRVPYPLALLIAYANEFWADCTGHMPVATVTGVKLTRRCLHFDTRNSLTALRLQPRPLLQTLEQTIDWFRTIGWIPPHAKMTRVASCDGVNNR